MSPPPFEKRVASDLRDERLSYGMTTSSVEWIWCVDLLQTFAGLLEVAGTIVDRQQRPSEEAETGTRLLNLYLIVCCLWQILADYRHRRLYDLSRLRLRGRTGVALRAISRLQHVVRGRLAGPGLRRRERALTRLATALAEGVLTGERVPDREAAAVVARLRAARWWIGLLQTRLRVPECFRGGDLYPADCAVLAERASAAERQLAAPVLVVGVRTSGVALAPLCAAALSRLGHTDVRLASIRPGVPLLADESRLVRRLSAAGGWALVVDGANTSGETFPQVIAGLLDLGLRPERICVAARQVRLGPELGAVRRVTIPTGEGHFGHLLSDEVVDAWLNQPRVLDRLHADAARVVASEKLGADRKLVDLPSAAAAGVERAPGGRLVKLFAVELQRRGDAWREMVLARGVGLGFFGYHSWLVATCVGDRTPAVLGIHDGILFMRWEPGDGSPEPVKVDQLDEIAAYVSARARRLDLTSFRRSEPRPRTDPSSRGLAASMLARPLGRAGVLAEPAIAALLDAKLRPARRSVVDGRMGPAEWLRSQHGGLLKVDFEEHDFEPDGPRVTDPASDIAAAVVGFRLEPDEKRRLIDTYVRLADDPAGIDARVVVYALQAALRELAAAGSGVPAPAAPTAKMAFARELAIRETLPTRTLNAYLADRLLGDVKRGGEGSLWALRLEGVLETDRLGFPSASPAGVLALRTLHQHGERMVLVTSRSLGELRERCQTFGLLGGIAEHGSVVWADGQRPLPIADSAARAELAQLREVAQDRLDAILDLRYQHCVVLFRYGPDGRRGLAGAHVASLLQQMGLHRLVVVEGRRSVAVRAAGCTVAAAFERLRPMLPSVNHGLPVSVVGAAAADDGLLRAAHGRYATSAGSAELLAARRDLGLRIASRPYQAGLLAVVSGALHGRGHRCSYCGPPPLENADGVLVDLLGLRDRGRLGRLAFLSRSFSLRGCEL